MGRQLVPPRDFRRRHVAWLERQRRVSDRFDRAVVGSAVRRGRSSTGGVGDELAGKAPDPFDKTSHDPGYIKGYPPGLRENGGQYSHAAMWAILALTKMRDGNKAAALFSLLNPVNHARTSTEVDRYKVEPYVVAADVYSVAPHAGRGGWTWYTGSAGWMYRAGVEGILGICREGNFLVINPCIPDAWPGFEATVTMLSTRYEIRVESADERGAMRAVLDGAVIECGNGRVRVPLDAGSHELLISLCFGVSENVNPDAQAA
jgi:cyclic beta-1,2-glucan synthetase